MKKSPLGDEGINMIVTDENEKKLQISDYPELLTKAEIDDLFERVKYALKNLGRSQSNVD